jgi:non-heme chloroperoxidase
MKFFPFLFCGSLLLGGLYSATPKPILKPTVAVEKSITLANRVTLQYAEQGDATGTPVIFLHGYTDSWRSFELVLQNLPSSIHAYAISQRGHGNSGRPQGSYHPKDFAADVAAFMRQMNIRKAVIVGHSMGATIAQRFAIDYPALTSKFVLVGSFASFADNEGITGFSEIIDKLTDPVDTGFIKGFQQSTIVRPVSPDYFTRMCSESQKVPAHVWKSVSKEFFTVNFTKELTAINKPALVIWGDKDSLVPRKDQLALQSAIKGSKLKIYEGTGHAVHWEEPQRFAEDLLEFISE